MKALMAAAFMTATASFATPHYSMVPKDLAANLAWRSEILQMASRDKLAQRQLKQMCAEDIMFYINGFCWVYDPRPGRVDPRLPFITYVDFQDEAIQLTFESIVKGFDIAEDKSRCMGASQMGLTVYEWFWHFRQYLSFLLISRNEKYVDDSGNPKSLFWKIDFLHKWQPAWLLPPGRELGEKDPNRRSMHLGNAETNSVIDGESTTGDAGRGDRRTSMFIDEHAAFEINDGYRVLKASRDTTRSRIFNSTPQGASNAFYEVVHKSGARHLRLHWSDHPEYNRGLYTTEGEGEDAKVVILKEHPGGILTVNRREWDEPQELEWSKYPFILDGKLRSPWYDNECARCVSDQEIAQELDIDYLGSAFPFFDHMTIEKLIKRDARKPLFEGDMVFDDDTGAVLDLHEREGGPLLLWALPSRDHRWPAENRYIHGIDISAGTGASNSVGSVINERTGEKVAVWRDPNTRPTELVPIQVALAMWFNKAYMIWDASGPTGKLFTQGIIDSSSYRNVYYRQSEDKLSKRISDAPGYFLKGDARAVLLSEYRTALGKGTFVNRSESGLKECQQFIVPPGGIPVHTSSINTQDPTGARSAHGDEVIADALACKGMRAVGSSVQQRPEPEPPVGSLAWRRAREADSRLILHRELGEGW